MKDTSNVSEMVQGFGRVVYVSSTGEFQLRVKPRRPEGSEDEPEEYMYSLSDIFEAHTRGAVFQEFPHLTDKDISLCSAFLATNVPDHPAYIKNNRGKRVKILFDENLPYALVSALTEVLPNLSHIYMEGMEGYMDEFIYNRPWYQLKEKTGYERRKRASTKHIIITRDSDLTDLARAQWRKRISSSAFPEAIKFDDVNVIFRVTDPCFSSMENIARFKELAKDIMRAAYSNKAASYTLSKSGIHIEKGSALHDLIAQEEHLELVERAKREELRPDERLMGRASRYDGKYYEIMDEMGRRRGSAQEGLALSPVLP